MSPLRMGSARGAVVSAEQLAAAATSLSSAVAAGGAELPEAPRERVSAVVEKVGQRTAMVGNRTVVALAGGAIRRGVGGARRLGEERCTPGDARSRQIGAERIQAERISGRGACR